MVHETDLVHDDVFRGLIPSYLLVKIWDFLTVSGQLFYQEQLVPIILLLPEPISARIFQKSF